MPKPSPVHYHTRFNTTACGRPSWNLVTSLTPAEVTCKVCVSHLMRLKRMIEKNPLVKRRGR